MHTPLQRLRSIGSDLLAILWPTACVGCGEPDRQLCANCLAELRRETPLRYADLGLPCFVRARYAGPARGALVAYKHQGSTGFARVLGAQLELPLQAALARCLGPSAPVIVCIPSRSSRVRERGYQHLHVLLRVALRGLRRDHPLAVLPAAALRTTRGRRSQVGLRARERAQNARKIRVRRRAHALVRGREVVLVDDVITTGATIQAARAVLEQAGATVAAAAAICGAERRDTRVAEERWRALKRVQ